MEPEGSSPFSQVPATCPYPEPAPSSPHNPLPFPEDHLNIILPSTSGSPQLPLYLRLIPLLEVINAPIQVPDIVDLIVSFKFLNFSFQICLLFVPEMSASITSYVVQIIYIALAWILYPLHFSLLPLI